MRGLAAAGEQLERVEETDPRALGYLVDMRRYDEAARVLLDEARDADLLVLGSRGRDGYAGLLLGSVS